MKYLITDPCYVVPDKEWHNYCDNYIDFDEGNTPYVIVGLGKIIASHGTKYGDGSKKIGNGEVLVDSGTVCIVELEDGVKPTEYQGNCIASSLETAKKWFSRAKTI